MIENWDYDNPVHDNDEESNLQDETKYWHSKIFSNYQEDEYQNVCEIRNGYIIDNSQVEAPLLVQDNQDYNFSDPQDETNYLNNDVLSNYKQ